MTNSEDYVSYEQAARLKAAGFDRECNHANPDCTAIPLWQAQKWLREEKRVSVRVNYMPDDGLWFADWLHLDSREYGDTDNTEAQEES